MNNLIVANFKTGFETDVPPFLLDNTAFPTLNNAYLWRSRIKRKRGNSLLGRLRANGVDLALGNTTSLGTFAGNLLTIFGITPVFPNASIVPGSITISITDGMTTETIVETFPGSGFLQLVPSGSRGTINYQTGNISIFNSLASSPITISFSYFSNQPVMGFRDHNVGLRNNPVSVAFDTKRSYQFDQTPGVRQFYSVNYFKNSKVGFFWTGADYQQFDTDNYFGAMWATNGVQGFHFKAITGITKAVNAKVTIVGHGIVAPGTGVWLWFNEVEGMTQINGLSASVASVIDVDNITINLDTSGIGFSAYSSGGIAQYLNYQNDFSSDGIRWYDGDPTGGVPPNNNGWMNFAPPLTNALNPPYLIGADTVIPFKNRLLFFNPWIATSVAPGGRQFQNRFVYCEVGNPFYTAPLPSDAPAGLTPQPKAWFQNVAGFGGFLDSPFQEDIISVNNNEDVLIVHLESKAQKILFTGDDSLPFIYQTINSELGGKSQFGCISLDVGVLQVGEYGMLMTSQTSLQRIDLQIPDEIFDFSNQNNGSERVCAVRDFRNEFIYFTYPPKGRDNFNKFPNKTLFYNFRENNWATFDENYTCYGTYRNNAVYTWSTLPAKTWRTWLNPWNFGGDGSRYPQVAGGNQQGFVMLKDEGILEAESQYVKDFNLNTLLVTSPDHCLVDGDYIRFFDAPEYVNFVEYIWQIKVVDNNTFTLIEDENIADKPPDFAPGYGSYIGGTTYARVPNIDIRTKQFTLNWNMGRKSRVGIQRYLLDSTSDGEVSVAIFCDFSDIVSTDPLISTYLPSTSTLLTHPVDSQPFQKNQSQIWQRISDSFVGDTIQLGFFLTDAQMRDLDIATSEITLHSFVIETFPAGMMA